MKLYLGGTTTRDYLCINTIDKIRADPVDSHSQKSLSINIYLISWIDNHNDNIYRQVHFHRSPHLSSSCYDTSFSS